jgi:TM2 domain-containing membrane protein YozV
MANAENKYCSNCGEQIDAKAEICPECGVRQEPATSSNDVDRTTAALLALLLGGVGAHKFYMGRTKLGLVYLCFVWTFIPAIVGFIEGIIYLTKSDAEFQQQYGKD